MSGGTLDKTVIAVPSERPRGLGDPCLVVIAGPGLGRRLDLGAPVVEIGRGDDCTFAVPGDQVSRKHASIHRILGKYVVADLGSTNGTFVNGERIEQQSLKDGDQIRVGELVLKYMESNLERHYHEQLVSQARSDSLTGALNKRVFDEDFARAAAQARAAETPLCLVLFDIDRFKAINDALGHQAGDEVLSEVAATTRDALPADASLYRVGGEEFAVVLPACHVKQARGQAEVLRARVAAQPFIYGNQPLSVTLSLGVAELANDGPLGLYHRADEKLYEAKRSGRDRVCG
jgi:diguanylate cyclase (GGDEF)-like protein